MSVCLNFDVICADPSYVLLLDRCDLQCPDQVEAIQTQLLAMLEYLYNRNHSGDKWLFTRTLLWFTEVRDLTEKYIKSVERVLVDWNNDVEFPPLAYELL